MTTHYEIRITFFTNDKNFAKTVNLVKLPVLTRKFNRSVCPPAKVQPLKKHPGPQKGRGPIPIGIGPELIRIAIVTSMAGRRPPTEFSADTGGRRRNTSCPNRRAWSYYLWYPVQAQACPRWLG